MKKLFLLFPIFILIGCQSTPTWTKATPAQRANLDFIEDDNYLNSSQYTNDVNDSVETVLRLRGEIK